MKQNLLFNQANALGMRFIMVLTMLLVVGVGQVWGAEEVVYTLTPAKGSNSSYTGTCDIEIDGVTWNLAGNSQMIPWRIGGKSITKTNRALYSKTAIQEDISKIVISHGAASSITVNSVTLIVSTSSNGTGTTISTLSSSFSANSTMTFTRPAGKSWAKAYYKIVYNVTVSGSSNKFIEFKEAKFYAETVPAVSYNVTWKVNGETYTTGSPSSSVSGGGKVTKLPTNPTLDCSGKTFVGWSNEEVTDGSEPDVLFTTAENSPVITEPTTFHAVFATKGSEQTATFDAATISGLTQSSSSLTWTHNTSGIALYLSAGQRYTSGTPNTFTVTSGTSNYCQLSAPVGVIMSKVVATLSGTNYKIYSVSTPWTLSTSSTTQTISSTSGSDYLKMSATSSYQIRITKLVVTYATYSDYTTSCTTKTVVTLNPNGGTPDEVKTYTTDETSYTLPECPFTRTGYTFAGWATSTNGSVVYEDKAKIEDLDGTPITLFAQWNCTSPTAVGIEGTYHFFPNETITLTATPTGGSTPTGYQWQKFIEAEWKNIDGAITDTYTKGSATTSDVGQYRCIVYTGTDCSETSAAFNVKCLQLYVYWDNKSDKCNQVFTKVDATTATTTVNMENSNYKYYFKITDGCGNWYGLDGDIHSGWCTNVPLNANEHCGLQTTKLGAYVFNVDYSDLANLKVSVIYPSGNQEAGKVIYWDNNVLNWTYSDDAEGKNKIYYRIGRSNHNTKQLMQLVPGTANLYQVTTTQYDNFEAWHIANNGCWSDNNSIYKTNTGDDWAATAAMAFEPNAVTDNSITVTPTNTHSTGNTGDNNNCEFYTYDIATGMKTWKAKVISATGGTITVSYTHHDGTSVTDFTSGERDLAHTCLLTITATPDAGYKLGTLTVNDEAFTSGDVHTLTEDAVIKVTWTEKATPTFAWSAATCTAALEADNTFPTLSNPNNLSVTYKSLNENVAKIDENGNVILGAVGETEITATGAETATHKSATTTYELTVVKSNCKWVEVKIGDIEPDDEVLITMKRADNGNTYTLDHSEGTSALPPAQTITINGNEATFLSLYHNNSIWNISGNATDGYILYPNGSKTTWLYCTKSSNNVKVGTTTNNVFTIDKGYLKHTNTDWVAYLGVYVNGTTTVWRHHNSPTAQSIANQTLKFYKRECLDATNYWVTWDAGEGVWTDGSSKKLESYEVGATITKPTENPTREGYRFDGWTPNPGTMLAQNTTFTAKWTQMHTITWMVGNNSVSTEKVANATGVTQTPASNPEGDAIGDCADTFLGWSEKSAGSTPQDAAYYDDLCTAAQMKTKHSSVTSDKIFYAVFATASSGGGENTAQVFATSSLGNTNSVTTGFAISAEADKKEGYYQDGSGTKRYVQVMKSNVSTSMFANTPTNVTVTAKLGGGTTRADLTNSVYAIWLDKDGKELGNAVLITDEITATTGSDFTVNLPIANATSAYGVRVYHQKESNYNVRYYAISLSYKYNNTTYSNYVTNCCALAPATNLTVSGTTSNTATLTWTAPSPTTGITKLQVRNAADDAVVVDNIAVGTTTATITGLTECTSYQYYVVSVGENCDVVSNIVTAQPFGNAKTVNYDYNGGSGSVTSFTTSCTNQTITLPAATRTGYDFNGWYTAATGGNKVGDAGDTYEPATSPVTLYAQWTIKSYTVTWNPNGGNWDGNTSNIVQTYEYGAAINKPDDPTRENGIFKGWTPTPASTMPAGNKTYTAQWKMVYTLTFVDMNAGGTTSTLTQTSSGQNIVAPTANSEVCDMWTFIGWAPSNSLNGGTDKPTGFIAAGETIPGSQITGNKTYYSVYSYNSDNTQEFEIGKSGTYLMYAISGTTKYYATTAKTGGFYGNPETAFATYGYPSKFKLTYNKTENKYIIYHENTTSGKESSGYFELNTSDGEVNVKSENASLFTIQAGSNESFIIRTDYTDSRGTFKERSFGYDGNFTDYSGDNPVYFEPASEIQYYNAADCGEVETYTMSFHNPFGDENALKWYDAEHEESYYTDKPLNTSIDVFPTMVYNGWAFIGWTANQQYNELIGDDNLDDENSATNDPASSLTIYSNTAGWSYKLNSNVTMYPVFTKYEDNEDIDLGSGGEYYMYFYREGDYYKDEYFGADNHYKRMYALAGGGDNGEFGYTTNCNNAQIFEFIKEGDGWNIRVKNADGSYPTKSYLVNTNGNDYDLVSTKPSSKWSITKEPEGDYTMWYKGNATNQTTPGFYVAKAREYLGGSSWNFKCYNQANDASQFYYKVYLGTCENRVFSSNPTNKPIVTLTGKPIVTSTQDQSIRAQGELSISATKLAAKGTITLTSDNADVYFSTVKDANFTQATKPLASLTLNADEKGKLATTPVYVHYKPTSTSNLGILTATITATTGTEGEEDYATAETTAHVRNLPAKFVIATKVGATWYALPADMNTASNPLGVVIEVDETNMTATAPNSCTYTLFPVKTTNTEYDRYEEYGDRLRFSAVNNSYKGLWANNSKIDLTINNDMVIDQASDGQTGSDLANNSYYEWKVTTTVVDGHWQYTLQTDQDKNQNFLRYWTSAEGTPVGPKWGTYNAGENKLYFLPVTETQPFEYAVVEWYPTKMLIQTDAAITSPTVKVRGEEVASPVLTSKGGKLYEISNLPLETNPNEVLQVSFTADAVNYVNAKVVPIILSRGEKSITGEPFATLTQKVYQYADVVVRDGATLTIDGGTDVANTLLGVTIYPTAKVSVAEGKKLSVHSLTFFGGIDEIYDGSAYTINKYGVPQLSLKGILNKTVTNMDYIMRVNLDQMYQVGVPYDVNLSDITYWDGTTMTLGDNLYVSAYDGQKRANREEKSWVWETDFTEKVLKAGIGYTISADKQDAAHEYSIIRMPMKNNIASGNTEAAKSVMVVAYDNQKGVTITDNHKGWNYLSNPYMVAISGAEADNKLVVGYLRETGTGPWEWVDDNYRYVTIPSDDGKWYDQQQFKKATLLPFKSFFLQIATSGELSFALASRQNAPARYLQSSNEQREVEFEVLLANDTRSDNLGFLIGEDYTPAYEINADLEKMLGTMSVYTIYGGYNLAYNALSPANAEEQIPIGYVVPTVGEYTWALDESSNIEDVEHIYLIDYETSAITDLVTDVYTFTASKQKSDVRFAINVTLKSKENTVTGLVNINKDSELSLKFIHNDKIYILHNGVIYDATGKFVETINK